MRTGFVGRARELAALDECLNEVLEGNTRLVLCQGEPGIGKTRLVEAFLAGAAHQGVLGVWGAAAASPGSPPYWSWHQVLRGIAETVDLRSIADEHILTAELGRFAPDLFSAEGGARADRPTPEDRFRQFDAIAVLLRHVARRVPLVVAFDAVRSTDEPSLLLLREVVRTVKAERLLFVVVERDTDPRAPDIGELLRGPATRLIAVSGLDQDAVGSHLASLLRAPLADAALADIHEATGGNPFFVGEVGRMLAEGRGDAGSSVVSANVRESIRARTAVFTSEAAELLQAASIVGDCSLGVLAEIVDLPLETCLGALDEAVAAGLFDVMSSPRSVRFTHAIIRDAIEAGMSTPERVRFHRARRSPRGRSR